MDILISTAIISLLSSVILFNVSEGKVRAQDAQVKVESSQVATAIEIYKTNNEGRTPIRVWSQSNTLPANVSTGQLYEEETPEYTAIMNKLVTEGYLSDLPKSPDNASYAYGENTEGTQVVFAARLRSSYSINSNTSDSCPVAQEIAQAQGSDNPDYIPQIPPCVPIVVGTDADGNQVSTIYCAPIVGLNVVCSSEIVTITPIKKGSSPQEVEIQNCAYEIPAPEPTTTPTEAPLCSGGNESDYCTCI